MRGFDIQGAWKYIISGMSSLISLKGSTESAQSSLEVENIFTELFYDL